MSDEIDHDKATRIADGAYIADVAITEKGGEYLGRAYLDLRAQLATAKEALEKYKGTGEVLAPSCGCLPGRETLWKCTHLVPFITPPKGDKTP